jgi:hypothetical protein
MKRWTFLLLLTVVLLGIFCGVRAEPKAYDIVKFHGKAGGATIALDYADGYFLASTLKVIEAGKTTRFKLDQSGTLHFVPEKGSGKTVSLKLEPDSPAPDTVSGTYTVGGKAVPFTLSKGK